LLAACFGRAKDRLNHVGPNAAVSTPAWAERILGTKTEIQARVLYARELDVDSAGDAGDADRSPTAVQELDDEIPSEHPVQRRRSVTAIQ
jgi:hypothetical protein